MSPLVPLAVGLTALAVGLLLQRSFGANHRVGRLLASTPAVSIAEALALAGGAPCYVRIDGRIDAETEFEDEAHRPLVFRRTRLQLWHESAWTDLDDRRERVPFELREGLDSIAIDDRVLDVGLVVVVRESVGSALDVADRVPPDTDPATPVRLRIEQVSSVEHAVAAGVPTLGTDGSVTLSDGLGRPLILTTLERSDAMRVLADGHTQGPILAAASLVGGLAFVALGLTLALIEGWS